MKLLRKFTSKDIIFLAILCAALTIASGLTMPLVMLVELFALRNSVAAIIYGMFIVIALLKVKKPGTILIVGGLHSFVLLLMSPVMFFSMMTGSILTEIITLAIFKNYDSEKSVLTAATLYIPLSIPTTLLFTMIINGKTFAEVVTNPLISLLLVLASFVLSFISGKIGLKIGKELQRAGKL